MIKGDVIPENQYIYGILAQEKNQVLSVGIQYSRPSEMPDQYTSSQKNCQTKVIIYYYLGFLNTSYLQSFAPAHILCWKRCTLDQHRTLKVVVVWRSNTSSIQKADMICPPLHHNNWSEKPDRTLAPKAIVKTGFALQGQHPNLWLKLMLKVQWKSKPLSHYMFFYKKIIILPEPQFLNFSRNWAWDFLKFFLTFAEINWLEWFTLSLIPLYTWIWIPSLTFWLQ